MRGAKDPQRGNERNYIPNDEIDREEKADIRQLSAYFWVVLSSFP